MRFWSSKMCIKLLFLFYLYLPGFYLCIPIFNGTYVFTASYLNQLSSMRALVHTSVHRNYFTLPKNFGMVIFFFQITFVFFFFLFVKDTYKIN